MAFFFAGGGVMKFRTVTEIVQTVVICGKLSVQKLRNVIKGSLMTFPGKDLLKISCH